MHKTVDLKSLLQVLRKYFILIASISIITMLSAVLYAKVAVTPLYVSSIKVYVNNKASESEKMTTGDIMSSQELVASYMVFMDDNAVYQLVAEAMDGKYSVSRIKSMLSFEQIGDSSFIRITAQSPSAEASQKICTVTAENAKTVIESVTKIQNVEVYGTANTPVAPSSPNLLMYALLGFLLGFAVTYFILFIRIAKDKTIKGKETILAHYTVPFFGEVPSFDGRRRETAAYDYARD